MVAKQRERITKEKETGTNVIERHKQHRWREEVNSLLMDRFSAHPLHSCLFLRRHTFSPRTPRALSHHERQLQNTLVEKEADFPQC